ncbi:MAG: cytochrome c oxidase subunit II [Kiloniellales bacterium]|nr:cytochrome c oxidase subunit II [Kiloniellales bacterium]
MARTIRFLSLATLAALGLLAAGTAGAAEPQPWQMGFQPAASPVMEEIHSFNNLLLWIISAIVVFVLGLLLYVMWRFSEKRNPNPSKTTHNTLIEVVWTVVPVIILVIIAIPSFRLLYLTDRNPDGEIEMTIKAIGHQWYWSYEFPDHGNFTFDAYMVADEDLEDGQRRLLSTDNALVLPVDTNIRILVTASTVLHNFAVPSMGLKMDGVPGRINETWVRITKEGTYYGQCSELCGTGHAYMPIMIEAVSKDDFGKWVEEAKVEFARVEEPEAPLRLADANDDKTTD